MAHFGPLPGDPRFTLSRGIDVLAEQLCADILALQAGGIDGIMLSNEGSQPWTTKPEPITVISMAAIIGKIRQSIRVPFGVHVIWDPQATIDLAMAASADFAWEIFTGVFASDFGLWDTSIGKTLRHQSRIQDHHTHLLYEVVPEAATYLTSRSVNNIVRSTVFNTKADAICIAGLKPGVAISADQIKAAKEQAPDVSFLASTGVRLENLHDFLQYADGVIVGTALKKEDNLWNPVDENRVKVFMQETNRIRLLFS